MKCLGKVCSKPQQPLIKSTYVRILNIDYTGAQCAQISDFENKLKELERKLMKIRSRARQKGFTKEDVALMRIYGFLYMEGLGLVSLLG